jgi:hypothetical protein
MIAHAAIEDAAATLRASLPVFTRGNLFHAAARVAKQPIERDAFEAALARRLERGPLDGLLVARPRPRTLVDRRERAAYFPAGILLVDRPAIVDLFAASGALVQSRVAVVDVTGEPRHVVRWLASAARAGHRAPVGYLHDARTVLYPFFFEPLATLIARGPTLRFRDLGFLPERGFRDPFTRRRVHDLEAATPSALIAYAVRSVLAMLTPDSMLAPRAP